MSCPRPPDPRPRGRSRSLAVVVVVVVCAALTAACGGTDPEPEAGTTIGTDPTATADGRAPATDTTPTSLTTTTVAMTTTPPAVVTSPAPTVGGPAPTRPSPTTPVVPPSSDPRVSRVTAADLGASWRPGCPVGPADLRRVAVTYRGFDGAEHDGALIVHVDAVSAIKSAFDRLRADRFPIRKIVTVDRYGGSDDASMADDNTSAFNCRRSTGSASTWSQHAYGRAVDVNPLENPYVSGSSVQPPGGAAYLDRSDVRTGMAVAGNGLVTSFSAVGWGWGGTWNTVKDYQHFSATGR